MVSDQAYLFLRDWKAEINGIIGDNQWEDRGEIIPEPWAGAYEELCRLTGETQIRGENNE